MDNKLFRGPDGTALRFFERAVKNNFQSEKKGHPVFDNCLMVEVIVPGSTESMPEFVVERTDGTTEQTTQGTHYERYKEAIESYKTQSGAGAISGTPLAEWPQVNAGQVQTFRAMNVHTVEQLSEVSDSNLGDMGIGARALRDKAKQWLSTRAFGVPTAQMQSENESLRTEVQRLNAENAELRAALTRSTTSDTPATQIEETLVPQPEPEIADEPTSNEDEADPFGALSGDNGVI